VNGTKKDAVGYVGGAEVSTKVQGQVVQMAAEDMTISPF
jgi:hypothetical protein